ncbi:MAG: AI-2E family transporter [Candidatus Levyibacteriota bacterium]
MIEEIKKQFTSVQILITLLIIAVSIYLFQLAWQVLGIFSDVIVIVVSAWVISFILEPVVNNFHAFTKIPKVFAGLFIYTLFFGIITFAIMLFIPEVAVQIQSLGKILPQYEKTSPFFVSKISSFMITFFENSLSYIPSFATFIFNIFIVLIVSFYFVIDRQKISGELLKLIPEKWQKDAQFFQDVVDSTFGSFLRVQLLFGLFSGVATWLVMTLTNVNFAASTALLAGLLTIIPLVGPIFAIIPPVLIAFLIDPTHALIVFLLLLIIQQIIFNVIGPKLLGNALKLHPIVVLLSFFVGYKISGPVGAVFAVPVLGVLVVLLQRIGHHYIGGEK